LNLITDVEKSSAVHPTFYDERIESMEYNFSRYFDMECGREALPFLCQYVFGTVCQQPEVDYIMPSSEECFNITREICPEIFQEWPWIKLVERPNCSTLPKPEACEFTQ